MATMRPLLKSELSPLLGKFLILSSRLFSSNDLKTRCKLFRLQTLICTVLFKGATQGCLPPCVFINTVAGKEALCFRTQSMSSKLWKLMSKIGFKMIISSLSVSRGRNIGPERTDRLAFAVRRGGASGKALERPQSFVSSRQIRFVRGRSSGGGGRRLFQYLGA